MTFIVATNVIASRPPERPPTATPHARAKRQVIIVATTSLPVVDARTPTAGMPHARAKKHTISEGPFFVGHPVET